MSGGDSPTLGDLASDLVQHTADRFGQVIESSLVTDVLAAEERKFRVLVSRSQSLLRRLYPSGTLAEEDYEFLRDTHGLPREVITALLGESPEQKLSGETSTPRAWPAPGPWRTAGLRGASVGEHSCLAGSASGRAATDAGRDD